MNGGMGVARTLLSSSPCWTLKFNFSTAAAAILNGRIYHGILVADALLFSASIHQN